MNVPEGWSQHRFEEITDLANGQVDPKVEPYLSMRHIGPENIASDTGQILGTDTCKNLGLISGKYEFDENSLVYSKIRPNLNKLCRPNFKGVCSADMYPIWAKNPKELNIDFLAYYMLSPLFVTYAVAVSMRTGMPKVNRSDLGAIKLALPPLLEQKKIARILSTWDRAIDVTEKLLNNSQQQKKALMQQLLTGKKRLTGFSEEWTKMKVSQIGKVITGSTPPKSEPENYGQEYSWATAEDFKSKYVQNTAVKLTSLGAKKSRLVPKGAVLVTCIASIGKNAIAGEKLATNQQINAVAVSTEHNNEFFYYLIEFFNHKLVAWAGVTAVPILNKSSFEKIKFDIPSLEEQQKIASVLSAADKEIEILEQKLACLRQEKKALMQQLLTGKRRVVP